MSGTRHDTDEYATQDVVEDLPGAAADRPREIPREGWKQTLLRVKDEIKEDNLALLAGGVALFALLAIPPAIVAAVTLWGLFADPAQINETISAVSEILPAGATGFLTDQISSVAESSTQALGWGLAVGVGAALWSASSGMKGMINAINGAYEEVEDRNFFRLRGLALLLTLGATLFTLLTIGLIAAVPAIVDAVPMPAAVERLLVWGRWPLLAVAMIFGLAALYHYGPARSRPRWRWVTPGAVAGTLIWLVASAGFAWYASAVDRFQSAYGAMAGLVVFILWLFLSAFAVLLGAELNSELEHQTAADSTVDGPSPIGQRGAYVADHRPAATNPPEGGRRDR